MISLPALIVTLLACCGTGAAGDWLIPKTVKASQRWVFGTALGLGFVSLAIFVLGLLQFWSVPLFKVLCAFASVVGFVRLGIIVRSARDISWPRQWEWLGLALVLTIFGLTLLVACGPVTDWDGLSYHLAVPKLYLQHGGIYWIPFIHHSNFAFATEMLFAPAVALNIPPSAKVVHWVYFALSACGCGMLSSRLFGKSGVWGVLAFVLMPVAMWESGAAYIDLATSAYTVLAALGCVRYLDDEAHSGRWLVIAALCGGMAAGTKSFSLVWIALLFVWIAVSKPGHKLAWRSVVVFGSIAGVICLPWYLKSWIMTGNPVYPFLYSVFGGKGWGAAGVEMYRVTFQKFGLGHGALNFLMLGWDFLANGGKFIDGDFFFGSPGPVFATILPASVVFLKGRARQLAVASAAYLAVWFLLSQQSRYLLPVLALGCSLSVGAAIRGDAVGKAVRCGLVFFGAISVVFAYLLFLPVWPVLKGDVEASSYIQRQVNSFWVTDYLPQNARVLLYGEPRGFYFRQTYMWADMALSSTIPYDTFKDPKEMLGWFRSRGWRYAVINTQFVGKGQSLSRDMYLWQGAVAGRFVKPVEEFGSSHSVATGIEIWEIP